MGEQHALSRCTVFISYIW